MASGSAGCCLPEQGFCQCVASGGDGGFEQGSCGYIYGDEERMDSWE